MTVTKEMIEAAWKKYREGCLAVRASKSDFMAGFEAALSSRSAEAGKPVEWLEDKVEGLQADLDSAVEVAYRRGAVEWTLLNYPDHFARLASTPHPDPSSDAEDLPKHVYDHAVCAGRGAAFNIYACRYCGDEEWL